MNLLLLKLMRHILLGFSGAFLLAPLFFFLFTFFVSPQIPKNKNQKIASPLPQFLTYAQNKQVTTLDLWLPNIIEEKSAFEKPQNLAQAVLVYDLTTEKTLFAKAEKTRLPMASLTKIMSAIISIENPKKDNKYLVYKDNLVGEDTMGLEEGEALTLEELLYGLLLPSGNDASEVLATNSPLGRSGFIKAMNNKAKALGLKDTNYTNPSGLEGDGNQYTTAYDLLVVTKYALFNYPVFAEIVQKPYYTIAQSSTHKEFYLENETNLLTSYPGVKGVKTGYTPEANLCLVTYLDYQGHKVIGILLASNNRRLEMKELLDYSLKTLGVTPPPHD